MSAPAIPINGHPVSAPPATDAVATYDPVTKTIGIRTPFGNLVLEFVQGQKTLTAKQMHLLSPLGIEAHWDPNQVLVFLLDCARRGLDPWAREVYLMLYPGGKYISHIGIDGFRRKAEETGKYRGRLGPQWCGPDGQWSDIWADKTTAPTAARVGILRAGFDGPVWGVAMYDEYAVISDVAVWDERQKRRVKTGQRAPSGNWRIAADGGKPAAMIAKCAEAAALRVAFPRSFDGLYVPEEFEQTSTDQPAADPGAAVRQAAYAAAQPTPAAATIDGSAVDTEPAAAAPPVVEEFDEVTARLLLLVELDAQATILERPVDVLVARWEAKHNRPFADDATVEEMVHHLGLIRPMVIDKLRDAGRHQAADRYAQAPPVAVVADLLAESDPASGEPA